MARVACHVLNYVRTVTRYTPLHTNGITRDDIRLALEKENIESRPLWKPMHMQPIFEHYPYYGTNVSEKLFDQGLCLPSGSNLSTSEHQLVINIIKELLGK